MTSAAASGSPKRISTTGRPPRGSRRPWLARRAGKPATFRAGLVLSSLSFASVFFIGPNGHALLFAVMAFSGAANVGFWMTLQALNADVTDLDELAHGERREGLFAGFAALVRKCTFAAAASGAGLGLTLIGYRAGQAPSSETVEGLKLLFAVPPTVLTLAALWVFRAFSMTRESHAEARRAIDARAAEAVRDAARPGVQDLIGVRAAGRDLAHSGARSIPHPQA